MKRVLAMWVDPESPNYGVRALAQGLIDSLPREWTIDFVSHRLPFSAGALSLKRLVLAAVVPWHPVRKELSRYDLIIDVGEGDSFASIYGPKRFGKMVASKVAASRSAARFVLAPQTLGPWNGLIWRCLARYAIAGASGVWARDSGSFTRAEALKTSHLDLASDLVFAVQDHQASRPRANGVVLNVSGLLWNSNPHVDSSMYRSIITQLMDALGSSGESVTLLAHVVAEGQSDDDVSVAELLGMAYPNSRVVIPTDLYALREVIADCRLLIGSRMHACLNALSLGVPTIPLGYSDKFDPLFGDLGYRHTIDLRQATNASVERIIDLSGSDELEGDAMSARDEGRRRIDRFFVGLEAHE